MEDWPDWYQLVPAFVATYGTEELQELEVAAELLEAIEEQDDVSLTEADLAYLKALETWPTCTPRCGPPSSPALVALSVSAEAAACSPGNVGPPRQRS
jgi:hypothetical protein